jgi:hypothetical protein
LSLDDLSILFAVYRDRTFLRAFSTLGEAERYAHKRGGCWIAVVDLLEIAALRERVRELEAQVAVMKEALEFYA